MLRIKTLVLLVAACFGIIHSQDFERACGNQQGAIWSPASRSCFLYFKRPLSWADAMFFCHRFKPDGTHGRLAHIPNPRVLQMLRKRIKSESFWIGMKSTVKGSPQFLQHWRWFDDLLTMIPRQPWNPRPYVTISIGKQERCMNFGHSNWQETSCEEALPFLCEYVPEPQHFCSMLNGTIWLPQSDSCAIAVERHLPWTEAMYHCDELAPEGMRGRLVHVSSADTFHRLKNLLPHQFMWVGMKSSIDSSKDFENDWKWMTDPLTPDISASADWNPMKVAQIRLNQPEANCLNMLQDRFNDYYCTESLPFICEFKKIDKNFVHRDLATVYRSVEEAVAVGTPIKFIQGLSNPKSRIKETTSGQRKVDQTPSSRKPARTTVQGTKRPKVIPTFSVKTGKNSSKTRKSSGKKEPRITTSDVSSTTTEEPKQPTTTQKSRTKSTRKTRKPSRRTVTKGPVTHNVTQSGEATSLLTKSTIPLTVFTKPSRRAELTTPETSSIKTIPEISMSTTPITENRNRNYTTEKNDDAKSTKSAMDDVLARIPSLKKYSHEIADVSKHETDDTASEEKDATKKLVSTLTPSLGDIQPSRPTASEKVDFFMPKVIPKNDFLKLLDTSSEEAPELSESREVFILSDRDPTTEKVTSTTVKATTTENQTTAEPSTTEVPATTTEEQTTTEKQTTTTEEPTTQQPTTPRTTTTSSRPTSQPSTTTTLPSTTTSTTVATRTATTTQKTTTTTKKTTLATTRKTTPTPTPATVQSTTRKTVTTTARGPSGRKITGKPLEPAVRESLGGSSLNSSETTLRPLWIKRTTWHWVLFTGPRRRSPPSAPPTTTQPPTTTTPKYNKCDWRYNLEHREIGDNRTNVEMLKEYCDCNPNGVWSYETGTCLAWYRRARQWKEAMERCSQIAPTYSEGRLAHLENPIMLDYVRSLFGKSTFFLWIGMQKRVGVEGFQSFRPKKNSLVLGDEEPTSKTSTEEQQTAFPGQWRWMENKDTTSIFLPWNPEQYVRLSLRAENGNCMVFRSIYENVYTWVGTPCNLYISYLCEYVPLPES